MFGLACGTVGFLVYGLAGTGWMFMLGLPISALWAIAGVFGQGSPVALVGRALAMAARDEARRGARIARRRLGQAPVPGGVATGLAATGTGAGARRGSAEPVAPDPFLTGY